MICADGRVVAQRGIVVSKLSADRIFVGDSDGTGFDFQNNGAPLTALPAILTALNATYTRNSTKNVVQNGALVTLSANQFGTSYDPVAATYGYVPEPAATNLCTNSDGNASTYNTADQVTDGTAVPGFTNGIYFGNNSIQRRATKLASMTTGTVYSVSLFIIMDDGGAPVVGSSITTGDFCIIAANNIASPTLTRMIGSNVYRISGSSTAMSTALLSGGIIKYTGQSSRTFRITGIQVETGLRATSYIATTGSTASRSADVLTVPLANITGFSSAGYTLAVDQRMDTTLAASTGALEISDGTVNNRSFIYALSGTTASVQNSSGGAGNASIGLGSLGLTRSKYAGSYQLNNILGAKSGVAGTADTSATLPVSPTTLHIGSAYNGSIQYNGFIFRAQLITQALTQAQINGLTT